MKRTNDPSVAPALAGESEIHTACNERDEGKTGCTGFGRICGIQNLKTLATECLTRLRSQEARVRRVDYVSSYGMGCTVP